MPIFLNSTLASRLWMILAVVAVLAFVGCLTHSVDCSWAKPLGVTAALAAAVVSFLDVPRARNDAQG